MAHFAELDSKNVVLRVIVVNDEDCLDENGNESEEVGISFCENLLGGKWKQTSYNGTIRKNYAGIGFKYDGRRNAFIPPQPFPSWVLNSNCRWDPPVPYPDGAEKYRWDEDQLNWVAIPKEEFDPPAE